MRSLIVLLLLLSLFTHAHDGHDHGTNPPAVIQNGKLKANDNITYFDAGADIEWIGQKLKRKITEKGQIFYQYNGGSADTLKVSDENKYLNLKVSGGEALKAFSFDHAGEMQEAIEITTPDFSNDIIVSKVKDLKLQWKPDSTSSMIKVIIETYSVEGKLTARLTTSTNDDGDFSIPASYLNQLPNDKGKIAIKRFWLGEFKPDEKSNDSVGVKSVVSSVGRIKVVE